jgi:hypothetical protein
MPPLSRAGYGVHISPDQPQNAAFRPPSPPMNKCFSPYPSLLLGGNEGGGGNRSSRVPQNWGASALLGETPSRAPGVDLGGKKDLCIHGSLAGEGLGEWYPL